MSVELGKQSDGQSNRDIYAMAERAFQTLPVVWEKAAVLDVGAGAGYFTQYLSQRCRKVCALDACAPHGLPPNAEYRAADLNERWPVPDAWADVAVALEVVEHLENPRHFFREMKRVLQPGGFGLVSTPNNLSLFSRLFFLLKGQHRAFQDFSYPAHITPVLQADIRRMLAENGLQLLRFFYTNADTLPLWHARVRIGGPLFSANFGVLFQKPVVACE